ncbi:MAG: YesL family protein [Pseudoflavonifractor sp.]
MFHAIFSGDNFVFRALGKVFDMVVLSALWLALCLPVVTIGPATAALYYACVKCIRRGEQSPYKNFWDSFRANFKVGAAAGIGGVLGCILLWLGWLLLCSAAPGDTGGIVMRAAYGVALVLPLGTLCYLFPVLSRFTFGVGGLFAASFRLAVKHLPSTVILVLMMGEIANICLTYWFPFLLAPALGALLASLFLERIFKKYLQTAQPEVPETAAPRSYPSMGDPVPEEEETPQTPWYLK